MTTNSVTLAPEQVEEFNELGYLILPAAFDGQELEEMAREADRILELCINTSLACEKIDPRLDVSSEAGDSETLDVRKLQPVKDLSDTFRQMSEDERLIGPLRQLMGHEPILMEEKLNYKQKVESPAFLSRFAVRQGNSAFPLHHDWGYYRQQGYPPETLSSAISIDATTPENGPIRVIPGTHLKEWPLQDPDPKNGSGIVKGGLFGEEARVDVIAPAGSVMLFHSRLLHDSFPNKTAAPRRLMIYSHYPGSHHFEEDQRNKWGRQAGQELEARYVEMVAGGKYQAGFRL